MPSKKKPRRKMRRGGFIYRYAAVIERDGHSYLYSCDDCGAVRRRVFHIILDGVPLDLCFKCLRKVGRGDMDGAA
jgi:hypothetical protein